MMSERIESAKSFHETIRKALIEEWDPIGIRDIPEAQDEYDSYISTIYKMLISRRPRHEVFEYLWWLEVDHMGLSGDKQRTDEFAKNLLTLVQVPQ